MQAQLLIKAVPLLNFPHIGCCWVSGSGAGVDVLEGACHRVPLLDGCVATSSALAVSSCSPILPATATRRSRADRGSFPSWCSSRAETRSGVALLPWEGFPPQLLWAARLACSPTCSVLRLSASRCCRSDLPRISPARLDGASVTDGSPSVSLSLSSSSSPGHRRRFKPPGH